MIRKQIKRNHLCKCSQLFLFISFFFFGFQAMQIMSNVSFAMEAYATGKQMMNLGPRTRDGFLTAAFSSKSWALTTSKKFRSATFCHSYDFSYRGKLPWRVTMAANLEY